MLTSLHKEDNPRGSNPTSPGSLPVSAGGCSMNGTDLERALRAGLALEEGLGEKAATALNEQRTTAE